jgi:DNA replication and repair protein RecF
MAEKSRVIVVKAKGQLKPILMLDDIYDKLDENRLKRLIDVLSTDEFGQVFITDTNEDRIKTLFKGIKSEMKIFNVRDGEIAQS